MGDSLQGNTSADSADHVEVFDNGQSIGSAPLINGAWTLPASSFAVGSHQLTATYHGLMTAVWKFDVENSVYEEGFEGLPVDFVTVIRRPYYTGTSYGGKNQVKIWGGAAPPMRGYCLRVHSVHVIDEVWEGRFKMEFMQPFSEISFDCVVELSSQHNSVHIRAHDADHKLILAEKITQSKSIRLTLKAETPAIMMVTFVPYTIPYASEYAIVKIDNMVLKR